MITPKQIARDWLVGEDAYQWRRGDEGKFPIADDVADLYKGLGSGGWDEIFYNRWSNFVLFRDGGPKLIPNAYQNLGKLAAAARALEVTLNVAALPEEDPVAAFESANKGSWLTLLVANGHEPCEDWRLDDFDATESGAAYGQIGLPLAAGQTITSEHFAAAGQLKMTTFDMLVGYTASVDPQLIPHPGVPSGEIRPWIQLTYRESD